MKKVLILGLCGFLASCASTGSLKQRSDISPIGIVAITSVNDIGWYKEKKENYNLLGKIVDKKIDEKTGENAANLLPIAEKALKDVFVKNNMQVLDSKLLLVSKAYLSSKEDKLLKASGSITAQGYRFVTHNDADLVKKLVAETDMKSGMYFSFIFNKNMLPGLSKNGVANAKVTMNVVMVNASGKVIMQKSYQANSKETFIVANGLYNPHDLMALFPDAIDQVCTKFAMIFSE